MELKIKMLITVTPDFPIVLFAKAGTILERGVVYEAKANKYGAVSGICENGEALCVKPNEFEFVEAPEWLIEVQRRWKQDNDCG